MAARKMPGEEYTARKMPGEEYAKPVESSEIKTVQFDQLPKTTTIPDQEIIGKSNYSPSFSAVKEMQQAILNFADVASSSYATHMLLSNQPEQRKTGPDGEYLGGSDPFGNFLSQHIEGAENMGLRGIINSIKQIGAPGKLTKPDGIWKGRTNAALLQISRLMQTINDLSQSMKLPIKGLSETIASFIKALPKDYTRIEGKDKAELAAFLTEQIKKITQFFSAFKSSVLDNKDIAEHITQEKPFAQYQQTIKDGIDILSKEERPIYDAAATKPIANLQFNNKSVSLYDLSSKELFTQFLQRMGKTPKDMPSVLTQFYQELGGEKTFNVLPKETTE